MKFNLLFIMALGFAAPAFADQTCQTYLTGKYAQQIAAMKEQPQHLKNPLLRIADSEEAPLDYKKFSADYFDTAIPRALKMAQIRLDSIVNDPAPPTYENTIDALISVTDDLDPILTVLYSYTSMISTPALEAVEAKYSPKLSQFSNSIAFNEKVFARVKAVYDQRASLSLNQEQKTVLENKYKSFAQNGASLPAEQKKELDAISSQIDPLTQKFKSNLSKYTDAYVLKVTDESRLKGIPEASIAAAKELAKAKSEPNAWFFTIQPSAYIPVVTYAEDRALREELWRAYSNRAASGQYDNRPVAIEIAQLRARKAKILGYETHAHLQTEDRMAQTPDAVLQFVDRLQKVYKPAAEKELADLKSFAAKNGLDDLMPWDTAYYAEKLQKERYGFDSEELRPYLPFDEVLKGALATAERLHHIKFIARKDIPVWHPDVRAFEVQAADGSHIGYYYNDPFARKGKRLGAWDTNLQESGVASGRFKNPHIVNVMNFAPPVDGKPALLTVDDVHTVFHELGHGLHGLLSKVKNRSISGTNVAWDFVEFPSQLNERWATEPDNMQSFAHHYQTGEVIPRELIEKVRASRNFMAAMGGLKYLRMVMIDMAWYMNDVSQMTPDGVATFEAQFDNAFTVFPTYSGMITPAFAHVFSGGYSAGYYVYKWADALVADAFELFEEKGLFDAETADRLRTAVLERGGSDNPSVLYRNFRGQEPDPEALLRSEGLIEAKKAE